MSWRNVIYEPRARSMHDVALAAASVDGVRDWTHG
jgi:hypothetical protein